MRWIPPVRGPYVVSAAALSGAAIALLPLDRLAATTVGRAGIGNLVAVNLLLPLAAAICGVAFPRVRTAILAGMLVAVGFIVARLGRFEPRPWLWGPGFLASHLSPIAVGASVGCAVVGAAGAAMARPFRRVGRPPYHPACPSCGHALAETGGVVEIDRCPECGSDLDRLASG